MSVAVVTSCYGGYDPVVAPPDQTVDAEWICVTDGTQPAPPAPWRQVIEWRPHLHPRMAAKLARCRPDLYTKAETVIWLDAAARLRTGEALAQLIDMTDGEPLGQFVHPDRKSISAEADVSATMRKYAGQPLFAQVEHYVKDGFPDGWGLWATGCIVRNVTDQVRHFGNRWMIEMLRWTWQDQLSEPYVLWAHNLRPADFHGNLWDNPLVGWDYSQRVSDA